MLSTTPRARRMHTENELYNSSKHLSILCFTDKPHSAPRRKPPRGPIWNMTTQCWFDRRSLESNKEKQSSDYFEHQNYIKNWLEHKWRSNASRGSTLVHGTLWSTDSVKTGCASLRGHDYPAERESTLDWNRLQYHRFTVL